MVVIIASDCQFPLLLELQLLLVNMPNPFAASLRHRSAFSRKGCNVEPLGVAASLVGVIDAASVTTRMLGDNLRPNTMTLP